MSKKLTKKEMFTELLNKYNFTKNEVDFINHEIELLDSKKGKKKMTATQLENANIKELIIGEMEPDKSYTIGEMLKFESIADKDYTNQKISALMRQLVLDNVIVRTEIKGKAYFGLA